MAGEALKDFLVALRFDVDENSYSKFNTRLGKATAGAVELGGAVTATALAVEAAVAKMARNFEEMLYVSQRTNSSIRAMQGFEYAARTVGVSSETARSAVEGLARAMRSNPGIEALLHQLGVATKGRGAVDIMGDLVGKLRQMPFYLAQQYGQQFGLDGDTLKMLMDHYEEFRRAQADYDARQKGAGVNANKLADDSHTLMNALRGLEVTFSLLGDRILQDFVGPVTTAVLKVDELARSILQLDVKSNGWITTIATVGTSALAVWIAKVALARVFFRSAVAEAAAAATTEAAAAETAAAEAVGGGLLSTLAGLALRVLGPVGALLGSTTSTAGPERDSAAYNAKVRAGEAGGGAQKSVAWLVAHGWTREQAIGIAANLDRESGFRTDAVGDQGRSGGVAQWNGDRRGLFRRMFGKDVTQATLEEQLQFLQHEMTQGTEKFAGMMIRGAGSADAAAAAMSKFYERPADQQGEAARRAGLAHAWSQTSLGTSPSIGDTHVTVNNDTDIHVKSTDPKESARETGQNMSRVSADTVRYLASTLR